VAQHVAALMLAAPGTRSGSRQPRGQIRAEGKVLNCGRRVGTAEGRITDSNGRLLAHGTTTCLIFEG